MNKYREENGFLVNVKNGLKSPRKIYTTLPDGWIINENAAAPFGFVNINNNKSLFSCERKSALLKIQ